MTAPPKSSKEHRGATCSPFLPVPPADEEESKNGTNSAGQQQSLIVGEEVILI